MITRMFGRAGEPAAAPEASVRPAGTDSPAVFVTARKPSPAPSAAPAAAAPFRNVRRSTFLCCSGSMLSMRALILGLGPALGFTLLPAAAVAQQAPSCTPARLNNSAVQAGVVTVSPLAGSRDASPRTQISFRGVPSRALRVESVVGSSSGHHPGSLRAYSQGDGASFLPRRPFAEGERVTVRAQVRVGRGLRALTDEFVTA